MHIIYILHSYIHTYILHRYTTHIYAYIYIYIYIYVKDIFHILYTQRIII